MQCYGLRGLALSPSPCQHLPLGSRRGTARRAPMPKEQLRSIQDTANVLKQRQGMRQQSEQGDPTEQLTQQEQLQQVLQLNPSQFKALITKAPCIMGFKPFTLTVTLDTALCDALYTNHRTVVRLVEQRPGILLAPYEPVQVLQQLSEMLGVSSRHAAVSLATHMQLLSLSPQQLQQRVQQLSIIMHWGPPDNPKQAAEAAAAVAGTHGFLQLLSTDPSEIEQQLSALAQTLGVDAACFAAVAQHYPRQLLQHADAAAAVAPQLQLLAQTAGVSVRDLLAGLEPDQIRGLAGLLLYEASWLRQQLRSLGSLTEMLLGRQLPSRVLVWLLLRLGTPNMFPSRHASHTRALAATLKAAVIEHQDWQQELQQATAKELAVLLSADPAAGQRALFLAATGKAGGRQLSLLEVTCWSTEDFAQQVGMQEYEQWSAQQHITASAE